MLASPIDFANCLPATTRAKQLPGAEHTRARVQRPPPPPLSTNERAAEKALRRRHSRKRRQAALLQRQSRRRRRPTTDYGLMTQLSSDSIRRRRRQRAIRRAAAACFPRSTAVICSDVKEGPHMMSTFRGDRVGHLRTEDMDKVKKGDKRIPIS